jgi:hypothetical protein
MISTLRYIVPAVLALSVSSIAQADPKMGTQGKGYGGAPIMPHGVMDAPSTKSLGGAGHSKSITGGNVSTAQSSGGSTHSAQGSRSMTRSHR